MRRAYFSLLAMTLAGCAVMQPGPAYPPRLAPTAAPSPTLKANAGVVSTLAARSDYLQDLTVDAEGNLYLAELNAIRKVSPDGHVTVLAGVDNLAEANGRDLATTISNPRSIAVDRQGTVYLSGYQRTWKLTPDGRVTSLPGVAGDTAVSLAVDESGNVYMASESTDTIHRLTPDGTVTPFAGRNLRNQVGSGLVGSGYQDGPAAQALFRGPSDLAIDGAGNLYVADTNNGAVRKIDSAGHVTTLVGQGKDMPLPPSPPPGAPQPDLTPFLTGRFAVVGIAADSSGTVYAASRDNRIHRIAPDGTMTVLAGDGTACPQPQPQLGGEPMPSPSASPLNCHLDGPGTAARFDQPSAIAVDGWGRVYVLDGGYFYPSRRLRKVE